MEDAKSENLKESVKERYSKIVKKDSSGCCCGDDLKAEIGFTNFTNSYEKVEGYVKEADLGLGCGVPTEFAGIKEGDIVVDLGSGAGNDVFVARSIVGESGYITGIDFTIEMLSEANHNLNKLGYKNVEFKYGDIENIPLTNDSADVVISNCVLNLVPDKNRAFSEIYRILKIGGHFCVSDIVIRGVMPEKFKKPAELYAGCISGALQIDEYLEIINNNRFTNVEVKKEKNIILPDDLLQKYLTNEEIEKYSSVFNISSISVVGVK